MSATHYHSLPIRAWAEPDNNYFQKAKFLKDHRLPRIDEIRMNIGSQLANIFFSLAGSGLRDLMELDERLDGPKEQMWVSPEDQLMGKMVLTEPYNRQLEQVMSHRNVLEIGQNLEAKIEKEREEHLKKELLKKEKEITAEMEKITNEKINEIRKEMENIYRNRLEYAKKQIYLKYEEMIKQRDVDLCNRTEVKLREALTCLRTSMAEEMEMAANRKMEHSDEINRFLIIWQANKAHEEFKKKRSNFKKKCITALDKLKRQCEKEKKELERKLNDSHSHKLKKLQEEWEKKFESNSQDKTSNFQKEISDLLEQVNKKDAECDELKLEIECAHLEQYSWCYLVRELLKQFQKFINYSLRQKPGEVQYLLSLEKLLQARISLLTESEFIREYIEEKCHHEESIAEDPRVRIQPLQEIKKEEMDKPDYCCLPGDEVELYDNKKRQKKAKETLEAMSTIIDKMIKRAIPKVKELPCIDSELWSSGKSEPDNVSMIAKSGAPGLIVLGDHDTCCKNLPCEQFMADRVKDLVYSLRRHPGIKLAIVGNS